MKICLVFIILVQILAIQAEFSIDGKTFVYYNQFKTYKSDFNKIYANTNEEYYAKIAFVYNKQRIDLHNIRYKRGRETYFLRENQLTDKRFLTFKANFPVTTQLSKSYDSALPEVPNVAPAEFDLITNETAIMDQGLSCNSGWAYAAASAIEILQNFSEPLSAQNLINCAGGARACVSQVPQNAFDFLTRFSQNLYAESEFPNTPNENEPSMCIIPNETAISTMLSGYGRLKDGDDDSLMRFVSAGYPVVVEFNPASFEFMHYGGGVFRTPYQLRGSHFMVVVGYGVDETSGLNYWSLLNSFGPEWGENGIIRVERIASKPITKNAILPLDT